MSLVLYDTTRRDGCQANGVYFSIENKLRALELLDSIAVPYVEGGWPGANPADTEFFRRARGIQLRHTKLAAFGSTCRAGVQAEHDAGLCALLDSEAPACTLWAKASLFHVEHVLRTTAEENLRMIRDSVRFLVDQGREVISTPSTSSTATRPTPAMRCNACRRLPRAGRAGWRCATPTAEPCTSNSKRSSPLSRGRWTCRWASTPTTTWGWRSRTAWRRSEPASA